jgi:hypothetical protein
MILRTSASHQTAASATGPWSKDDQPTERVGVHSMNAKSLVRGTGCGTLTQKGEAWLWSKKRRNMKVSEAIDSIQKRDIVQPKVQPGGGL